MTGLVAIGEVEIVVCEATLGDVRSSSVGLGIFLGVSRTLGTEVTGIKKGSVYE